MNFIGINTYISILVSIIGANNSFAQGFVKELLVPNGYKRTVQPAASFGAFLRGLPLKAPGSPVLLYDGTTKADQNVHVAVLDLPLGKRDLQQCADAVIRLRAEYLFDQKNYEDLHFNFTSGDVAYYKKYAEGYRAHINGNKVTWTKKAQPSYSNQTFQKYLDLVYTYAGTYSLSKELKPVTNPKELSIGDVFIQGGFPGHAVIVIDMAVHANTGEKIFMLAQSYMPAQEIHILKNYNETQISPWYKISDESELYTPEWTFGWSDLKKFK